MDPVTQSDVVQFLSRNSDPSMTFDSVVVTGSTGMLGSYILDFLSMASQLSKSHTSFYSLSRRVNRYLESLNTRENITVFSKPEELFEILNKNQNIHVIHAASPASVQKSVVDSFGLFDANIALTLELAKLFKSNTGHFTYLSSGEIYGTTPIIPTRENDYSGFDHLSIRGAYPEFKRAGELILKTMAQDLGFSASSFRLYHTFGPGIDLSDSRIFAHVLNSVVNNRPIRLQTNGQTTRTFMYSSDLIAAIAATMHVEFFSVFNVAGDFEMTVLDFAKLGQKLSNGISEVLLNENTIDKDLISTSARGHANTDELKKLGWSPLVTVEESLFKSIESLKWRMLNRYV
jgi:UDP-glucuronate decarboxylase